MWGKPGKGLMALRLGRDPGDPVLIPAYPWVLLGSLQPGQLHPLWGCGS